MAGLPDLQPRLGSLVLQGLTLMGINTPIRIGRTTVMPGDAVLGKREGVAFIPPHLVREVVERSEEIRLRDAFGHQRLREAAGGSRRTARTSRSTVGPAAGARGTVVRRVQLATAP